MSDTAMQLQTFSGSTVKDVLAQVREHLGEDALIVDQRRVGARVQIRACIEPPPEITVSEPAASPAIEQEQHLLSLGFAPHLLARHPDHRQADGLLDQLLQELRYLPQSPEELRGVHRFIGASGSGKTTALIRLLSLWRAQNKQSSAMIISTDDQRLASAEPLHLAGQLLDVPVLEVASTQLEQRLSEVSAELVLIDTPSLQSDCVPAGIHGVSDWWLISATQSECYVEQQHRWWGERFPNGVVITQTDQWAASVQLMSLLHRWGLPITWLSHGNDVTQGIESASATLLKQRCSAIPTSTFAAAV